jgi:hypothetical protein
MIGNKKKTKLEFTFVNIYHCAEKENGRYIDDQMQVFGSKQPNNTSAVWR